MLLTGLFSYIIIIETNQETTLIYETNIKNKYQQFDIAYINTVFLDYI